MDPKAKAVSDRKLRNKKKKQRSPAAKFVFLVIKILIVFFVALSCALAGIVGGAVFGYIRTAPPIPDDQLDIKILTTSIYDMKKNEIAQLKGSENKNRILVKYEQTPKYLRDAFVSIEDERYYQHHGIDFKRTLGAGISYITHGGHSTYGGSTITQQVIKNITGNAQTSLERKVQEQWRALQLEKKLTKPQILELYMNLIYMGYSFYGVESASRAYFNKDVWDLSLAQCASLAGITNSPGDLDPFTKKGKERNISRQKTILKKMLELGYIKQAEYDQAIKEDLKFNENYKTEVKKQSNQSYFVDQVILDVKKDLMDKGYSEDLAEKTIYNYGLKIYTTQDTDVQKCMDPIFVNEMYFPSYGKNMEHPQAAMVVMDPANGQIRAMYGGFGDKKANLILNRASGPQMQRSTGSSIKPIADYGPAVDLGLITASTVVDDVPVHMDTLHKGNLYPRNFSLDYKGLTTIRDAIKRSVNVVAAKVWRDILTPDQSIAYLKKAGIDRDDPAERTVSLALGGLHKGLNPLQVAAAYVPFDNNGVYYEPITYTKVVDRNGNVILEKAPVQKKNVVYKETTSYVMTNMMQDVCRPGGTGYPLAAINQGKMPSAGKTGTTSDDKDRWFVGYTPYYVAATWYGYDSNYEVKVAEGYNPALKIWSAVMNSIHKNLKPKNFAQPEGIVKKVICIDSGKIATNLCSKDPRGNRTREEVFISGTEPADDDTCKTHVQAKICKASKDVYGRYKMANSSCPSNTTVEQVFIVRGVPFMPFGPKDPFPLDFKYELAAGEYCSVHGGAAAPANDISNIVTDYKPPEFTPVPAATSDPSATSTPGEGQ